MENSNPYVQIATEAIRAAVYGEQPVPEEELLEKIPREPQGVFVTLKKGGKLRGCMGTYEPVEETLADEIMRNAASAAKKDPRFSPVSPEELDQIKVSVSLLKKPKTCKAEDLDPNKYGVIVKKGARRGLLLPNIEEIDTVEKQLRVAKRKAGIDPTESDVQIKRFKAEKYTH